MNQEAARCRLILSAVALGVLIVDDVDLVGGRHGVPALAVIAAHFAFAAAILLVARRGRIGGRLAAVVPWADTAFAVVLGATAAGIHGPFFAFAAFAVVTTALTRQPREALHVTLVCVVFYAGQVLRDGGEDATLSVMRAVCLAILGYLVVRLAHTRLTFESDVRLHEAAAQRAQFARQIHDGCAALLATIDVRLETSRELIRAGRHDEARADLARLRDRVGGELHELRAFARRLADAGPAVAAPSRTEGCATRVKLEVRCEGSAALIEAVIAILGESVRNVERHAFADHATLRVGVERSTIRVEVTDDGVGFASGAAAPWSIASRVAELGGLLNLSGDGSGARLSISLPRS